MTGLLLGALATLLHAMLMAASAALLPGVLRWLAARLQGRAGPPPWKPLRAVAKLLRTPPLLAENASIVTRAAPYVAVAALAAALLLVPSFARATLLSPLSDLLLIGALLALARVAQVLAALDAGTAQGGLGAARGTALAALAWPAFLVAVLVVAMATGGTGLDAASAALQDGVAGLGLPVGLALAALVVVALADAGRLPLDRPDPQPEAAMLRGAMILEASGRHLALWDVAAALRLLLWVSLLLALWLPHGTAASVAGWPAAALLWVAKLAAVTAALAAFEATTTGLPPSRLALVPGVALLLALAGALLLFVPGIPA